MEVATVTPNATAHPRPHQRIENLCFMTNLRQLFKHLLGGCTLRRHHSGPRTAPNTPHKSCDGQDVATSFSASSDNTHKTLGSKTYERWLYGAHDKSCSLSAMHVLASELAVVGKVEEGLCTNSYSVILGLHR